MLAILERKVSKLRTVNIAVVLVSLSEIRILNLNCVTGFHKSQYDHYGVL